MRKQPKGGTVESRYVRQDPIGLFECQLRENLPHMHGHRCRDGSLGTLNRLEMLNPG